VRYNGLAILLATVGCSAVAPAGPSIEVHMSGSALGLPTPRGEAAPFYVVNRGAVAAEFLGCPGPIPQRVQRLTPTGWQDYVSTNITCQAIHTQSRLTLAPGDSVRQDFSWDLPGYYRIHVLFGARPDAEYSLVSPYSEPFEIR
jgi:hypothetical protein